MRRSGGLEITPVVGELSEGGEAAPRGAVDRSEVRMLA